MKNTLFVTSPLPSSAAKPLNDILSTIKETLENFGIDIMLVTPEALLVNDLGLDSLDFAELIN